MYMAIHWGALRHLRKENDASAIVLVIAILLNVIVLASFLWVKETTAPRLVLKSSPT